MDFLFVFCQVECGTGFFGHRLGYAVSSVRYGRTGARFLLE